MKRHHVRYVPVPEAETPRCHVEAYEVNRLEAVLDVAEEDKVGPVDIFKALRAHNSCLTQGHRHDTLADIARD